VQILHGNIFFSFMLPLSIGIKFAIPNCLMNKMSGLLRGTSEKTYEEQYTLRGRKMAGRSPGEAARAVFEYDGRTVQRCFGDFLFMVRIFLYTKILRR
jgi:hypothetical protein